LSKESDVASLRSSQLTPEDGDGRVIGNRILRSLPRKESLQVASSLEFVRLKLHQVLHETGETIKSIYFLNEGLGSVLTTQPDGKSVEVG
jgi:CRP-like cAMP-binding protein